jgi:hypothetical protein
VSFDTVSRETFAFNLFVSQHDQLLLDAVDINCDDVAKLSENVEVNVKETIGLFRKIYTEEEEMALLLTSPVILSSRQLFEYRWF